MKILHYFLGFPPYRTGGMTKVATDLIEEQANKGNIVYALWPGKLCLFRARTSIKTRKRNDNIYSCEIINPLPVPYDEGIKNPKWFMRRCKNPSIFQEFIKKNQIDVVHIHTLMGLHKEFVDILKKEGIKTIYTTHDYYPICQMTYLTHGTKECSGNHDIKECAEYGRANGLSFVRLYLLQTRLYRMIKNITFVSILRKKHRKKILSSKKRKPLQQKLLDKYKRLNNYYKGIVETIDLIHFNSKIAKSTYEKYFKINNHIVLPISNKNIVDKRDLKKTENKKIRLLYLADKKQIKGFDLLIEALDKVYYEDNRKDIQLNIYNSPVCRPYINNLGNSYTKKDLEGVFKNSDILIAPSIWKETFGLTVEESLAYGTPVVVTNTVGAKDVVSNAGIIIKSKELYETIKALDKQKLRYLYGNLYKNRSIMFWDEFEKKIKSVYKNLLENEAQPKVSIIVPVYNVENQVKRCIESIINQTYKNTEIIIVDDGSTDNSLAICKAFLKKANIRIISQENRGLSAARNTGLDNCTGDYVMFVDSDDYILKDACEKLMEEVPKSKPEVIVADCVKISDLDTELWEHKSLIPNTIYNSKEYLQKTIPAHEFYMPICFNVYNRQFLARNNLRHTEGILHEDVDLTPRIFLHADKIMYKKVPFYQYIIRDGSITTRHSNKNAQDLLTNYSNWKKWFDTINDKSLKKTMYKALNKYYISSCRTYHIYAKNPKNISNAFLLRYTLNPKEFLKTVLFITFRKKYVKVKG